MKKIFLSLLMTTSLLALGFSQTKKTNEGEKRSKSVIAFTTEKYNFGSIPQGKPVTHSFTFTNAGKEPLFIKNAQAPCGCTIPEYSKEAIAPGGNGMVKVTYDAQRLGHINKTVTITTNSATTPVVVLAIGGEVKSTSTNIGETKTDTAKPAKS